MTREELLRGTARSFALTIRLLPRTVRDEVALAYLVARATDTIADSPVRDAAARREWLRGARASLGETELPGVEPEEWAGAAAGSAERALLRRLPQLWMEVAQAPADVAGALRRVLASILDGQIFDLERFAGPAPVLSAEELERYTYLVAGSVGEFWTELCAARIPDFTAAPADVAGRRARHYGQALQLVNILRDRRMDAALGRVYLAEAGVARWTRQARLWLQEGADYCADLRPGRLRYATVLPALFGWRTLKLVEAQPPGLLTPAKMPRAELRSWMCRALPVWWSAKSVSPLARRAAD